MENNKSNEQEKPNYKIVSMPLQIEELKEFFTNKESKYIVEYSKCELKDHRFIAYVSNLEMNCLVDLTNCGFGEKSSLILSYMESKNMVNIPSLLNCIAQILLEKKGINTEQIIVNSVFTKDEMSQFIKNNSQILQKWINFIDSSPVYMMTLNKEIEEKYKPEAISEQIDDINYIGLNVAWMFSVPCFLEFYLSAPNVSKMYYFKQQFKEYMFRGKNLFSYFCVPENTLFVIYEGILSGNINLDNAKSFLNTEIEVKQP